MALHFAMLKTNNHSFDSKINDNTHTDQVPVEKIKAEKNSPDFRTQNTISKPKSLYLRP